MNARRTAFLALLAAGSFTACSSGGPDGQSPGGPLTRGTGSSQPDTSDPTRGGPVPVTTENQGGVELLPTPTPPPPTPPPPEPTEPPPTPVAVSSDELGSIDLIPAADPFLPGRDRRRMNIDQLARAIDQATDGIRWVEKDSSGKETVMFESLAQTLGEPDYILSTQEDLTASLIFEKFLADAANNVCRQLVERERNLPREERVLMGAVDLEDTITSAPDRVEENLRILLRRYHSRSFEPLSPELEPWAWLFESATHVAQDPVTGWRTVCVGLITHPDFFTY